jgi:hypothetical protein
VGGSPVEIGRIMDGALGLQVFEAFVHCFPEADLMLSIGGRSSAAVPAGIRGVGPRPAARLPTIGGDREIAVGQEAVVDVAGEEPTPGHVYVTVDTIDGDGRAQIILAQIARRELN